MTKEQKDRHVEILEKVAKKEIFFFNSTVTINQALDALATLQGEMDERNKELQRDYTFQITISNKLIEEHLATIASLREEVERLKRKGLPDWQRTSDIMPTEQDANSEGKVLCYDERCMIHHEVDWNKIEGKNLKYCSHWMALPKK